MKVRSVHVNRRRRCFELDLGRKGVLDYPFARSEPKPTGEDPVIEAAVDEELGREGVSFRLASGAEGVVLADQVLDYHGDPDFVRDQILHRLTVAAMRRMEEGGLGVREVSRRLRTSPSQILR